MTQARTHGNGVEKRNLAELLTLAFRAADRLAIKFGHLDLSARFIGLMRQVAVAAEDHLLLAAWHLRAAVVAERLSDTQAAKDHLREAGRAAREAPEGANHGTAFGPDSLRIHELAVAAELRDPAGIERAASWHPPRNLACGAPLPPLHRSGPSAP